VFVFLCFFLSRPKAKTKKKHLPLAARTTKQKKLTNTKTNQTTTQPKTKTKTKPKTKPKHTQNKQVREVASEAIARARRGDGPTLIEAETYRFRGHSLADPDELRSKEEKAHYAARDPIPQLKAALLKKGWATEGELKEIEKRVADEVDDAVRFADESPKPEKGQLLENVFADPRGFGVAPDGRYRYELPGFTSGTAAVS
jgi:TPP-dependent pyruvate/acetoin dehydrogenase alpha subunit